jgi:hypothetical protein
MFDRNRAAGLWVPNTVIDPGELELWDQQISDAIDGAEGGAYAPSNPIEIGGAGVDISGPLVASGDFNATGSATFDGATSFTLAVTFDGATATWSGTSNLPRLGTRSYIYPQNLLAAFSDTATVITDVDEFWVKVPAPDSVGVHLELQLPRFGTLTAITAYILPVAGSDLPATPARLELYKYAFATNTTTQIGTTTTEATYRSYHAFSMSGLSESLNGGTTQYRVRFLGEAGTNAKDVRLHAITATVTVDRIAP